MINEKADRAGPCDEIASQISTICIISPVIPLINFFCKYPKKFLNPHTQTNLYCQSIFGAGIVCLRTCYIHILWPADVNVGHWCQAHHWVRLKCGISRVLKTRTNNGVEYCYFSFIDLIHRPLFLYKPPFIFILYRTCGTIENNTINELRVKLFWFKNNGKYY